MLVYVFSNSFDIIPVHYFLFVYYSSGTVYSIGRRYTSLIVVKFCKSSLPLNHAYVELASFSGQQLVIRMTIYVSITQYCCKQHLTLDYTIWLSDEQLMWCTQMTQDVQSIKWAVTATAERWCYLGGCGGGGDAMLPTWSWSR